MPTKLDNDDCYEEIAATYQCLQIDYLNEALLENGIRDSDLRKEICKSFAFHYGVFNDQFWFEANGERWFPIIGFTTSSPYPVLEADSLGTVQLRSAAFEFHEYAHGNVAWYFEEHGEDASEIQTGNE
jgi:hypothetical protein